MNIDDIRPYPRNAKKHPKSQVEKIAKSIKRFGFNQPIVIDKNNEIVVGHGRYEAAKLLGLQDVPVVRVDSLSEEEVKAYRLADNKLNESEWDMELALEDLRGLSDEMMELTGFDSDILSDIVEDKFDAGKAYEAIKEPKTKRGDIYELGEHKVMCGDTASDQNFRVLMGDAKGRLIFTDPLYNVDYKSQSGLSYDSKKYGGTGGKMFNDNKSDQECIEFYAQCLENLKNYTTEDATIYWWFANKNNWINREAFRIAGWHMSQIIIWVKNSFVFSRGQDYHRMYEPCMVGWREKKPHYKNKKIANLRDVFSLDYGNFAEAMKLMLDIWYQERDNTKKYLHPTQKPVRLAERALKKNSERGDIVIDAFLGSGSTLIACEQMERVCYGMELDPKYCDVIVRRHEQFTGQKSNKIR